jgi:hypothetical protein
MNVIQRKVNILYAYNALNGEANRRITKSVLIPNCLIRGVHPISLHNFVSKILKINRIQ